MKPKLNVLNQLDQIAIGIRACVMGENPTGTAMIWRNGMRDFIHQHYLEQACREHITEDIYGALDEAGHTDVNVGGPTARKCCEICALITLIVDDIHYGRIGVRQKVLVLMSVMYREAEVDLVDMDNLDEDNWKHDAALFLSLYSEFRQTWCGLWDGFERYEQKALEGYAKTPFIYCPVVDRTVYQTALAFVALGNGVTLAEPRLSLRCPVCRQRHYIDAEGSKVLRKIHGNITRRMRKQRVRQNRVGR